MTTAARDQFHKLVSGTAALLASNAPVQYVFGDGVSRLPDSSTSAPKASVKRLDENVTADIEEHHNVCLLFLLQSPPSLIKSNIFAPQSLKTPEEILAARTHTILRVQTLIQKHFNGSYKVENFGSTRYGVDKGRSDLDLVILVSVFLSKSRVGY
jgi:hypothetical protein